MRALLLLGAAAVAGVAIARRKTLKDDATKVTAVAKDSASKLNERVRGQSEEAPGAETAADAEVEESGDEAAEAAPAEPVPAE